MPFENPSKNGLVLAPSLPAHAPEWLGKAGSTSSAPAVAELWLRSPYQPRDNGDGSWAQQLLLQRFPSHPAAAWGIRGRTTLTRCPGSNCTVYGAQPSLTALLQSSGFCSKLFNYGKNHFSSLKDCRRRDHHPGIICSLSFEHLLGHGEAPGEEHQASRRRARSCLSQHPLISLGTKVKALKMLKITRSC